jgi:hypothetical protein
MPPWVVAVLAGGEKGRSRVLRCELCQGGARIGRRGHLARKSAGSRTLPASIKEKSMRFARKLVLLAVAAAATMALTAASAQALEIFTEAGGAHCTAVTPTANEPFINHGRGGGGCQIKAHSVGTVEFEGPIIGMTECNNVFEGRSNELGEGFIYEATITGCTRYAVVPCAENGVMDNWILHVNQDAPGIGMTRANGADARFCVTVGGAVFNCHLLLDVTEPTLHRYEFSTGGAHRFCEGSGTISVRGRWEQEIDGPHPAIEIR